MFWFLEVVERMVLDVLKMSDKRKLVALVIRSNS